MRESPSLLSISAFTRVLICLPLVALLWLAVVVVGR